MSNGGRIFHMRSVASFFWSYGLAGLCVTAGALAAPGFAASTQSNINNLGNLPLFFEANQGQTSPRARYLSRGVGHVLWLSDSDAILKFKKTGVVDSVALRWVGGKKVAPEAEDPQEGKSNYLIGADQSKWKTEVPHFGRVRYRAVYPGIDLVFYGKQSRLEYDFLVAPNADASKIRLQFDGAKRLSLDNGDLLIKTAETDLRQLRPVAYQETAQGRRYVSAEYVIASNDQVKLKLGAYDAKMPLVIDPVISWTMSLSGSNYDLGEAIALDAAGNSYVTGATLSADLLQGSTRHRTYSAGGDAYVAKINAAGTAIVYVTFLGGGGLDAAHGIRVDSQGNAVVIGETNSSADAFPASPFPLVNAADGVYGGGLRDAFVTKLNAAGNTLLFSTFIGGTLRDVGRAIAVDTADQVYVAGYTNSADLSSVTGTYQGGATTGDAFVAKLTPLGAIAYCVYQGGTKDETGVGIAVDQAGNAYLTGETDSPGLPGQGFQPTLRGTRDGYIAKLNSSGVRQFWAYFGGGGEDVLNAIALDPTGNIYVVGDTVSADLPLVRPLQATIGGGIDAFIAKISGSGTEVLFSSYIGGSIEDRATSIAVEPNGSATVAGYTLSANFPVVNSVKASFQGFTDAYVVKYTPTNNARYFSTLIGDDKAELVYGVAVSNSGVVYITGSTEPSANLSAPGPREDDTIVNAFASSLGGCSVALTPLSAGFDSRGGLRTIEVQPGSGCGGWSVTQSSGFITFPGGQSGNGNGSLTYRVDPNPGLPRNGTITLAGQVIPITQAGSIAQGCAYTVSQPAPAAGSSIPHNGDGGTGSLTITAAPNCAWSVYSNTGWAQVSPISGTGNATINYTLFPNFGTSVRTATITAAGQARTVTQLAGIGSQNQRFVKLAYFSFLGRLPDATELAFQTGQLTDQASRVRLMTSFYNTEEFLLGGRFIGGLYVGLLDRDAEFNGWLFQRNALATGVVSQQFLSNNFITGAEYQLRFGNPANADFVRLLYRYVLLREATQAEVNTQVTSLTNGTFTRSSMANFFLNSAEFRSGAGPRLTGFLPYATLLQRDPSAAEFAAARSKTVEANIAELLGTAEFNNSLN
jgi:hypothetical protein